jgi:hypothetical protein
VEVLAAQAGPFVYHLTERNLVRMRLDCTDV